MPKFLHGVFALSVLQLANLLFPLISVPYLARILSVGHYGLILFSLSFSSYFNIICDYGFNLSAAKEIAIHKNNKKHLDYIVSHISYSKILLFVICIFIQTGIIYCVPELSAHWLIYNINLLAVFGNTLFPLWLFQGLEKMWYITSMQLFIRFVSLILIFMFIKTDADYWLWNVFNSVTLIIIAIVAQIVLIKKLHIDYLCPNWQAIKYYLVSARYIFLSQLATSLFTTLTAFFLGAISHSTIIVAYYVCAEKILNATNASFSPLYTAIVPFLAKKLHQNVDNGMLYLQKSLFVLGGLSLCASIFLFFSAHIIISMIFGVKYQPISTEVLRILSILPVLVAINNIFGAQTLLSFGLHKAFAYIVCITGAANIACLYILVPRYGSQGAAYSVVLAETIAMLLMFACLYYNGIYVWVGKLKKAKISA